MSSVRKRVAATTVAALCVVTTGCTSSISAPTPSPSPSPSTPSASVPEALKLNFSVYGDEAEIESYVHLANAFTSSNSNVTITVSRAPDADAAMDNLRSGFDNGNPPDVFLAGHQDLPALVAEELVQPVDQLLEDRELDFGDGFQRDTLAAFSADAALQCMPHDVSPLVVYYNEELLDLSTLVAEDEEPPTAETGWTWEQFAQAASQMSRGRVKGVYLDPSLEQLTPFIRSAGGEVVDDVAAPTTLTLSDGDTRAALEQVLTLARDPQLTPTQAEIQRRGAVARFKRGRIAMILGTRELTPELRAATALDFEVMPLPSLGSYRTVTAMNGYCISSQTENVEAAADFLAFAVGREGATITSAGGYVVPSNLEVALSPVFIQPGREPANSFVFNDGVRRADPMPFVPEWPEVLEAVRPSLEQMFYTPVIDLDVMLDQIDALSEPILAPEEETPTPE